jgi:hypothetical protein
LKIQNHLVVVDTNPNRDRDVTVALLALHVVFVLDGHPEFIWSTFEHIGSNGAPDLAPSATANPTAGNQTISPADSSRTDYVLYRAHTPTSLGAANTALVTDQSLNPALTFDEATQTFKTADGVGQTSIFRVFPGSKSGNDSSVDDEVQALNDSMSAIFGVNSTDRRSNYRLIGGVWLKHPKDPILGFKLKDTPSDLSCQSTDDPISRLQGEDRLSGMAMESFTQTQFVNCFQCHNTQNVTDDDSGDQILPPKKLNVSHVLSKFLSSPGVCQSPSAKSQPKGK